MKASENRRRITLLQTEEGGNGPRAKTGGGQDIYARCIHNSNEIRFAVALAKGGTIRTKYAVDRLGRRRMAQNSTY